LLDGNSSHHFFPNYFFFSHFVHNLFKVLLLTQAVITAERRKDVDRQTLGGAQNITVHGL
jgi:hypothetical protein